MMSDRPGWGRLCSHSVAEFTRARRAIAQADFGEREAQPPQDGLVGRGESEGRGGAQAEVKVPPAGPAQRRRYFQYGKPLPLSPEGDSPRGLNSMGEPQVYHLRPARELSSPPITNKELISHAHWPKSVTII